MFYQIGNWVYETEKELLEGIEFLKDDIAYLKTRALYYKNNNNDFISQKVEDNIKSRKTLLNEFLELLEKDK